MLGARLGAVFDATGSLPAVNAASVELTMGTRWDAAELMDRISSVYPNLGHKNQYLIEQDLDIESYWHHQYSRKMVKRLIIAECIFDLA